MLLEGARTQRLREHFANGTPSHIIDRAIVDEAPVALEINGIGYAVMMATPANLDDYALGFCLSEQLIDTPDQFQFADAHKVEGGGWMLRIQLTGSRAAPLIDRVRLRLSEGSCGLCGIESLEQVMRPLSPVTAQLEVADSAFFAAAAELRNFQPLGRATGSAHAAAFCTAAGTILHVREDVGRHNALDKLLGALAKQGISPTTGFILLTARCSFELVQKAVIAGCPVLATISAASTLAVDQATSHGLRLVNLLRADSFIDG